MPSTSRGLTGCQIFDSHDLPALWVCMPLGDRIHLLYGSGLREADREPGHVEVYGSNGVVGSHRKALVDGPGVLVGRKGTVGAIHHARRPFWPIDTVYYVRPHAGDDLGFLSHLLDYLPLKSLNAATGVPGLSRRDAYALRGVFPPITEQTAIAGILDAAETALQRTKIALERSRQLRHSLLHELLERGLNPRVANARRYPRHWSTVRVDEVATVGSGVTLGKDVSGQKTVDLPYLRVANVQDGYLDLTTVKTIRVPVDHASKYRLEAGDVLMTEGGDIDKLGRGAIWDGQIPDCLHQNHVFRIRPKLDKLEPSYYALVVESEIAKRYFSRVAKRTTNLASTNKAQVRAFRFPIPPTTSEQRQIVEVMRETKTLSRALWTKEAALRELKRSLAHDLLTGKVRVGDASGEVGS